MTNPTAEINAFIEQSKKFAEPLNRLALFSVESMEKLARLNYGVAGDALEYSIAALQTGATTHEVPQYFKAQTTLAQTFVDRQTQRAQELNKLAEDIRNGYASWFDAATSELKSKTVKAPEAA